MIWLVLAAFGSLGLIAIAIEVLGDRTFRDSNPDGGPVEILEGGKMPPAGFLVRANSPDEAINARGIPKLFDNWVVSQLQVKSMHVERDGSATWKVLIHYEREKG